MLRIHDEDVQEGGFDPEAAEGPLVGLSEGRADAALSGVDTWVREVVSR